MVFAQSLLLLVAMAAPVAPAETVYRGGTIITVNDAQPVAEALAVAGGKIIAVGSEAEVMKHRDGRTKVVDLGGKTLMPGFLDSHGHVTLGGLQALSANLLSPPDGDVVDIPSLVQIVKTWASKNEAAVKSVNLIVGFGYDPAQLRELRHPTKEDLDLISKEIPVLLIHQSSHLAALNSKALEMAGIDANTKDPAGGVIQRKPGGQEPNGVLEENAMIMAIPKLLASLSADSVKTFAKAGTKLWASFGYTTAQEGRSNVVVDNALIAAAKAGELDIDVVSYPDILMGRDHVEKSYSTTYANRFRVGGAKLSIDGSPQGFTAFRDRPYYAPVGNYPPGYLGYASATAQQVLENVEWCYSKGIQLLTHSNGEAASDMLIAAIGAAERKHPNANIRPVLIHGQFLREDQVDAYVRLGVIPSLFPMHTFYWGDWHRDHTVGPVASNNISPTGWFRTRGSIFTTHHDAPVAFPNSMRVLDATVTRRSRSGDILGPDQRVDVMTGIKAMTIWAAQQYFEEKTKGSLEVGKLADLVILSKNPLKIDPERIDEITVDETIKEGRTIFVRGKTTAVDRRQQQLLGEAVGATLLAMASLSHESQGVDHNHDHDREGEAPLDAPHAGCGCELIATWTAALAGPKPRP